MLVYCTGVNVKFIKKIKQKKFLSKKNETNNI